jgi:hypothetical protein
VSTKLGKWLRFPIPPPPILPHNATACTPPPSQSPQRTSSLARPAPSHGRWEEEKAFLEHQSLRIRRRRDLLAAVRDMEELFAAEDLALRKKGGRRNPKAEAARDADRAAKRDALMKVLAPGGMGRGHLCACAVAFPSACCGLWRGYNCTNCGGGAVTLTHPLHDVVGCLLLTTWLCDCACVSCVSACVLLSNWRMWTRRRR